MHAKTLRKIRKAKRNRAKISGSSATPRLSVFRSNKYLHVQLIDDASGKTIISASTSSLPKEATKIKGKLNQATELGRVVARLASEKGINNAVFDRGSYKYHGRVKAVADGARAGGLKI